MSSFSSLNIALSGLFAARRGLDVTGQNVANANTEGYSRQRVEFAPDTGPATASFFSRGTAVGGGVVVADVTRAHDAFLTARRYEEHGAGAALTQAQQLYGALERLVNEPGDQGLQKLVSEFWAGWDEVGNHPDDQAARSQLLQRAQTLVGALHQTSGEIDALQRASVDQLSTAVAQVNTLAAGIAEFNERIQTAHNAGVPYPDLLDQRDVLISRLSDLVGVTVRDDDNGTVDVFVSGTAVVRGDRASALAVDTSGPAVQVVWTKDNYPASVTAGQIGGLLTGANETLPLYRTRFDAVAVALRDTVNAAHARLGGSIAVGAQDLSAAGPLAFGLSVNGAPFATVTVTGADWSGPGGAAALQSALQAGLNAAVGAGVMTATVTGGNGTPLEVALSPVVPTDVVRVSALPADAGLASLLPDVAVGLDGIGGREFFVGTTAASLELAPGLTPTAVAAGRAAAGPLDASVAADLAEAGSAPGGPTALYRDLVVALGVEAQSTYRRAGLQAAATRQIDNAVESVSGVSLDEEMANLVQFEHAYSASARVMTAIDEMLNTLINHTGLAGR